MAKQDKTHLLHGSFLPDDSHFRILRGVEQLGRAYQYDVTFYADRAKELQPKDVLGESMSVEVKRDSKSRFFHGIVTSFANLGVYAGYLVYQVELRPELWLLTQQIDCRIFQEKTAIQVVESVLKDGATPVNLKKNVSGGNYEKLPYCTQYRESSYDFVCRLLEKVGATFYFTHEKSKHTMELVDSDSNLSNIEPDSKILFRPPGESLVGQSHISRLQNQYRLLSAKTAIDDFDYENPKSDLTSKSSSSPIHNKHSSFERYDYPGKYTDGKFGTKYSAFMLDEIRQDSQVSQSFGNSIGLNCGQCFKLDEHPVQSRNVDYLITRAEYDIESGEIEQMGDSQNRYEVTMNLVEKKTKYRTPSTTPKPFIRGPQTAFVVGKSGEEIWTDKYGRVKIQFHWDREGKSDENSSCWVRVAQGWAGKNWGMIYIPRIGHEVIVEFLEGDPDRPIVTGSVYNGDNQVPYALPANQTKSGLLTRTSKGSAKTGNELSFEDKKDSEQIYLHAQKDFTSVVKNDDTLKVEEGNRKATIEKGDDTLVISEGNRKATIEKGDDTLVISKGNRNTTIESGDDTLNIKKGDGTIKAAVGKIMIEAAKEITLKVGGSQIVIKPAEIVLKSTTIKVQASTKSEVKGSMVDVKASGIAQVKGGMVKIN